MELLKPKKRKEDYNPEELSKGSKVELEHTTDPSIAENIAMNHLDEFPNYYTELLKLEESLKAPAVKPDERCVYCGVNHLETNGWHLHHHNQVICEKHMPQLFSDMELQGIREEDKKTSPHPEWFPEGRKNIGMTAYLKAVKALPSDRKGELMAKDSKPVGNFKKGDQQILVMARENESPEDAIQRVAKDHGVDPSRVERGAPSNPGTPVLVSMSNPAPKAEPELKETAPSDMVTSPSGPVKAGEETKEVANLTVPPEGKSENNWLKIANKTFKSMNRGT